MHYQEFNNFSIVIYFLLGLCLNLTNFLPYLMIKTVNKIFQGQFYCRFFFLKWDKSENTLRDCTSFKSVNLEYDTLVCWDNWIVDQSSDVPSIFFFKFLIDLHSVYLCLIFEMSIWEFITNSKRNWFRNKLDFLSSSNLIFTACVACKNQFRNQIDFLNF